MSGDNAAANSEAQPHPMSFRREKGLKDALHFVGRNSTTPVSYRYTDFSAIQILSAHEKSAFNRLDPSHRVAAVHDEVEQHLLELYVIAGGRRQMRCELDIHGDILIHQVASQQLEDALHQFIHLYRLKLHLAFIQQRAHPVNDFPGTPPILAYIAENCPKLVEIRRMLFEENLRRFS